MRNLMAMRLTMAAVALGMFCLTATAQEVRVISERVIQVTEQPKPGDKPADKPAAPVVVVDPCCNPCPAKPCCQKPCREPMICVPEPDKRTIRTTVFSSKESPYCLKKCSHGGLRGLFKGHGCCDPCDPCAQPCATACGECDKVRYKNVLLKRVVTTECPDYKCVPKPAPICCPNPCGPGTIIEVAPAPKPKD